MASNQRSAYPCTRSRIRRRCPRCFISHHLGIIIQSRLLLPTLVVLLHPYYYLHLLVLLPAVARVRVAAAYFGPTHCIKPGTSAAAVLTSSVANTILQSSSSSTSTIAANTKIMGYSTYNHLLFDLISLSDDFRSGRPVPDERLTFILCPNKVIDLDESTLPLGYLPIDVPRTTLQCGSDGSRSNRCVVRGGGKRDPRSNSWNARDRERAYKRNEFGILGGGEEDVAQIYVDGDAAYGVTLRGLTMDNSVTEEEAKLYREYVAHSFGNTDGGGGGEGDNANSHGVERKRYLDAMAKQLDAIESELNANAGEKRSGAARPARRFASVAVRGGRGSGNDNAGPRIITVEDCEFTYHRGYAILVSPGMRGPEIPMAPVFNHSRATSSSPMPRPSASTTESLPLGQSSANEPAAGSSSSSSGTRTLNLLDDGAEHIPADGRVVTYYDHADKNRNGIDGHRVKIIDSDFVNNDIASDTVAGLVASAYSLTIRNCLFEQNSARSIVFVYNREAAVENTMFVKNVVNVSTVIMQTPKGQGGSKASSSWSSSSVSDEAATNVDDVAADGVAPPSADDASHVVRRSCFLGSSVGMSNVLVTDAGYAQRDNFGKGTEYAWASKCEDGAAEKVGDDCATNANCTGRCVPFAGEECAADRVATSSEYESFANDGCSFRPVGGGGGWRSGLGAMLLVLFPLISYL